MTLIVIDSLGHLAEEDAAASIVRMRAAGMPPGDVTSAYRSDAEQAELRRQYENGTGSYALRAGESVHRTGRAIDFKAPQYRWLEEHGDEHGWHNPTKAPHFEAWHWEYVGAIDQHRNNPAATAAPIDQEDDDDMAQLIRRDGDKKVYLNAPALGVHKHIATEAARDTLIPIYGEVQVLAPVTFDRRRQLALDVRDNPIGGA